jgi:hypothetical protein
LAGEAVSEEPVSRLCKRTFRKLRLYSKLVYALTWSGGDGRSGTIGSKNDVE